MGDPQIRLRQMVVDVAHSNSGTIPLVAFPLKIPTAPPALKLPPPTLGEHTDQVLNELLGFDAQTIQALHTANII